MGYIYPIKRATTLSGLPESMSYKMETVPLEIAGLIASYLDVSSLKKLRLVCRAFSTVAWWFLARNLFTLNTLDCLQDVDQFLRSLANPRVVKSLTIYHCRWPVCTATEWIVHPLLGFELQPHALADIQADTAYQAYSRFIRGEESRTLDLDLAWFRDIIQRLPMLSHITIDRVPSGRQSQAGEKFTALWNRIWLTPFRRDLVTKTIQPLLILLPFFPRIRELQILGTVDPMALKIDHALEHIRRLRITSFLLTRYETAASASNCSKQALKFLSQFPNLETLELRFSSRSRYVSPLDQAAWPRLRHLTLSQMYVSEECLLNVILHNPNITSLQFDDITMDGGEWASFFSHLRLAGRHVSVRLEGRLYRLRHEPSVVRVEDVVDDNEQLSSFISNHAVAWPFPVVGLPHFGAY